MSTFYVASIFIAVVGIFSARKITDLVILFKVLLMSILTYLIEDHVIPLPVGIGILAIFFSIILVTVLTMSSRKTGDEDEVDRL